MTKTISILVFVSSLTFGCAGTQVTGAGRVSAPQRGEVLVQGRLVKAVVVGPAAIHAYSAFSGGTLYVARAASGTDADCQDNAADGSRSGLRADSVVNLTVGAGQVACLATSTNRSFELLWHVQRDPPAPAQTLLARDDR
jgi:hypothetical protein